MPTDHLIDRILLDDLLPQKLHQSVHSISSTTELYSVLVSVNLLGRQMFLSQISFFFITTIFAFVIIVTVQD